MTEEVTLDFDFESLAQSALPEVGELVGDLRVPVLVNYRWRSSLNESRIAAMRDVALGKRAAMVLDRQALSAAAEAAEKNPDTGQLEVRLVAADGRPSSTWLSYVNLWRALKPGEEPRASGVSGSAPQARIDDDSPVVWDDPVHGVRWLRTRSAHGLDGRNKSHDSTFRIDGLPPGRYRTSVVQLERESVPPREVPIACGASKPFDIEIGRLHTIEVKAEPGEANLALAFVSDDEVRRPISGLAFRLRNAAGMPIVRGHGSGNFFERTNDDGTFRYVGLPAGDYTIEVLGKAAQVNDFVDFSPLADAVQAELAAGVRELTVAIAPRRLDQAEIDERFPYSIFGRVTDEAGTPVPGVAVRAMTGEGTLQDSGRTTTDAEGRYRLYFEPGLRQARDDSTPLGVGIQAAHFHAEEEPGGPTAKGARVEFLMTDLTPEQFDALLADEHAVWGRKSTDEVVFQGRACEVDFRLRPAQEPAEIEPLF